MFTSAFSQTISVILKLFRMLLLLGRLYKVIAKAASSRNSDVISLKECSRISGLWKHSSSSNVPTGLRVPRLKNSRIQDQVKHTGKVLTYFHHTLSKTKS